MEMTEKMKKFEEIQERKMKLLVMKELYSSGELPYSVWQHKKIELEVLKWVLGEIEGKDPLVSKKGSTGSHLDQAINILKKGGEYTARELFPSSIHNSNQSFYIEKLKGQVILNRIGTGSRNNPYRYFLDK